MTDMEAGWAARQDELIIDPALDRKYEMALARLGVDPAMLSTEAGHA
jgi:putative transcriptional regulator